MKNLVSLGLYVGLCSCMLLFSCEKDDVPFSHDTIQNSSYKENPDLVKLKFSKALAQAVNNEDVRLFLKNESLAKYDGDYDILYAMVKDKKLNNGKTFEQIITLYSDPQEVKKWHISNPLLTIFVPEIENFSSRTWDVKSQIPHVVIEDGNQQNKLGRKLTAFSPDMKKIEVDARDAPNFPVIVVKDNERIVAKDKSTNKARMQESIIERSSNKVILENEFHKFCFIGDIDPKDNSKDKSARRVYNPLEIDAEVRFAYIYLQMIENQRDWVYYWLNGSNQSESYAGIFLPNYTEYIKGFKFNNTTALGQVSHNWTDGALEFHILHSYIYREGNVQSDLKVFYCQISDLYTSSEGLKEYNPNVELVPWNMERYGDEWAFTVLEHNSGGSTTITTSLSSKFGTNFEVNATIKKVGLKFGSSSTFDMSGSIQTVIQSESSQLGVARVYFNDPVITSSHFSNGTLQYYDTHTRGTGSVDLSIEPFAKTPGPNRDN